jgi:hypothetical protein
VIQGLFLLRSDPEASQDCNCSLVGGLLASSMTSFSIRSASGLSSCSTNRANASTCFLVFNWLRSHSGAHLSNADFRGAAAVGALRFLAFIALSMHGVWLLRTSEKTRIRIISGHFSGYRP